MQVEAPMKTKLVQKQTQPDAYPHAVPNKRPPQ